MFIVAVTSNAQRNRLLSVGYSIPVNNNDQQRRVQSDDANRDNEFRAIKVYEARVSNPRDREHFGSGAGVHRMQHEPERGSGPHYYDRERNKFGTRNAFARDEDHTDYSYSADSDDRNRPSRREKGEDDELNFSFLWNDGVFFGDSKHRTIGADRENDNRRNPQNHYDSGEPERVRPSSPEQQSKSTIGDSVELRENRFRKIHDRDYDNRRQTLRHGVISEASGTALNRRYPLNGHLNHNLRNSERIQYRREPMVGEDQEGPRKRPDRRNDPRHLSHQQRTQTLSDEAQQAKEYSQRQESRYLPTESRRHRLEQEITHQQRQTNLPRHIQEPKYRETHGHMQRPSQPRQGIRQEHTKFSRQGPEQRQHHTDLHQQPHATGYRQRQEYLHVPEKNQAHEIRQTATQIPRQEHTYNRRKEAERNIDYHQSQQNKDASAHNSDTVKITRPDGILPMNRHFPYTRGRDFNIRAQENVNRYGIVDSIARDLHENIKTKNENLNAHDASFNRGRPDQSPDDGYGLVESFTKTVQEAMISSNNDAPFADAPYKIDRNTNIFERHKNTTGKNSVVHPKAVTSSAGQRDKLVQNTPRHFTYYRNNGKQYPGDVLTARGTRVEIQDSPPNVNHSPINNQNLRSDGNYPAPLFEIQASDKIDTPSYTYSTPWWMTGALPDNNEGRESVPVQVTYPPADHSSANQQTNYQLDKRNFASNVNKNRGGDTTINHDLGVQSGFSRRIPSSNFHTARTTYDVEPQRQQIQANPKRQRMYSEPLSAEIIFANDPDDSRHQDYAHRHAYPTISPFTREISDYDLKQLRTNGGYYAPPLETGTHQGYSDSEDALIAINNNNPPNTHKLADAMLHHIGEEYHTIDNYNPQRSSVRNTRTNHKDEANSKMSSFDVSAFLPKVIGTLDLGSHQATRTSGSHPVERMPPLNAESADRTIEGKEISNSAYRRNNPAIRYGEEVSRPRHRDQASNSQNSFDLNYSGTLHVNPSRQSRVDGTEQPHASLTSTGRPTDSTTKVTALNNNNRNENQSLATHASFIESRALGLSASPTSRQSTPYVEVSAPSPPSLSEEWPPASWSSNPIVPYDIWFSDPVRERGHDISTAQATNEKNRLHSASESVLYTNNRYDGFAEAVTHTLPVTDAVIPATTPIVHGTVSSRDVLFNSFVAHKAASHPTKSPSSYIPTVRFFTPQAKTTQQQTDRNNSHAQSVVKSTDSTTAVPQLYTQSSTQIPVIGVIATFSSRQQPGYEGKPAVNVSRIAPYGGWSSRIKDIELEAYCPTC